MIKRRAACYATAHVPVSVINKHGIVKAEEIGIRKVTTAVCLNLQNRSPFLLIDAFYCKYVKGITLRRQKAIIHGDEISLSIAAASIIAKVERDFLMEKLANKFPGYKFEFNKGYGTAAHRTALKKFGATRFHRTLWISRFV